MPNFRSLGQSLHINNFCKNDGVGGGKGGVKILKGEKAGIPCKFFQIFCKITPIEGRGAGVKRILV